MSKLTAICPLLSKDMDRFRILVKSLDKFFDPASLQALWVIVPDEDLQKMKKTLEGISERHTISILPERDLNLQTSLKQGWFLQQLIKLKIATKINSFYYLVLDADVICCKPVSYAQLIPNGRALLTRAQKTSQLDWWNWAGHLLSTSPRIWKFEFKLRKPRFRTSRMGMGVTPALLSTRHTLDLIQYLQDLWQLPVGELLSRHRFTEYTLYYLYLEMNGLVNQVHQTNYPVRCSGSGMNVWHKEQFEQWNVDILFTDPIQPGFFTVCQSNTGIPAEAVWQKVFSFLDTRKESV